MSIELRPNQVKPVEVGIEYFHRTKPDPAIVVLPTAWGKSILIAKIAEAHNERLIVISPTKELLAQNLRKFMMLGGQASIYSASFNSKRIGQVTYATIGSIKSLGKTFKEMGFTKMVVDEIHLMPRSADSMFGGFLADSEISHVLGLTATPLKLQSGMDRWGRPQSKLVMLTSRSKHGNFFKEIIHVSQIKEMVDLKFWSKLEYEQYVFDDSGLKYNTTKADYTEESLKEVYKLNNMDDKILAKLRECWSRKSIIVFVPSVDHARKLSEKVPMSCAVYSGMPDAERDRVLREFISGKIKVAFNVNILSVGFDHPELDTIIMARPTASLAWFYQALGRGTRIAPLKTDCLVVDFSGNVAKFGMIEQLHFKKENIWKLYGEGGNLLTGVPLHEIGKHNEATEQGYDFMKTKKVINFGRYKGREIKNLPSDYMDWMLGPDFKWNDSTQWIKDEIIKIKAANKIPVNNTPS